MVPAIVLKSRQIRPVTTRMAFRMSINVPTFMLGIKLLAIMEMPVVPPMARWLGVLKI